MEQIPTKVQDFLDEDPPVRGQNYVCLSFVSPEDILKTKDVFFAEKYVEKFVKDVKKIFDETKEVSPEVHRIMNNLKESYPHMFDPNEVMADYQVFKQSNTYELDKEFHDKNNYQTSVRGIKVRGVYDTFDQAKHRADFLKRNGDKFDIFIGQVGCWCPWSPNPEDVADSEYAETQLNTFMKKFKESTVLKDKLFEERKQMATAAASSSSKVEDASTIAETLTDKDPWLAQKEVSDDK